MRDAVTSGEPSCPTVKVRYSWPVASNSLLGQVPIAAEPGRTIRVQLSLAPGISFAPEQMVFVAAVRTSGSPMPLAAQKLTAADLPATVTLSDSLL